MNGKDSNHHDEVGPFQIVVLILSVVVLVALFVDTAFRLPEQISKFLQLVDTSVCFLLLLDFALRFRKAKSKLEFIKWGWIDLVASIPNLPMLRVGRLIRILRIIRLLRAIRATSRISNILLHDKLRGSLASAFITFFLLIMFASVGILICEQGPDSKITTAGDAIWWSVATITTVGYGDMYPVTPEGRCIAIILMISGVGMFGVVSGTIASVFIGTRKQELADKVEIIDRLKRLEDKIDKLTRNENQK